MSKGAEMKTWKKPGSFETIRQIRGANRAAGHYFFSEESMAFFGSQIERGVHGGRYFITSEQDPQGDAWDGERRWTIRAILKDGSIRTAGEFGAFRSREEAIAAVMEMIGAGEEQE